MNEDTLPEWLPELIKLNDSDGKWKDYLAAIYNVFKRDFVDSKPKYAAKPFGLKRHPIYDNKESNFWHTISEGPKEEERTPDLRRCERISWPKPIIEAMDSDNVYCWRNKRGKNKRILIALKDFSYLVVLEDRKKYVLLWTTYCLEQKHRKEKNKKEYEKWKAANP